MPSPSEPEAHHRQLHRRLKDSFGPTYLTAVSVIQGVALADLGAAVLIGYRHFALMHWLLVALTFLLLILIWNAYISQSTLWSWLPDLRDAIIPFLFGALELVVNRAILLSLSGWLAGVAFLSGLAAVASWYSGWRAREEPENEELLNFISRRSSRLEVLYPVGLTPFLLALALLAQLFGLQASADLRSVQGLLALAAVLIAALGLTGYLVISARIWNEIVAYARTGKYAGTAGTNNS
jgi:hypothetical protein